MSVGIVGGLAQVVRMELGRAQQLSTMVGTFVPEAAALVRPQIPEALEGARTAVTLIKQHAPSNVRVEIGTDRVLKQIGLMIDDVNGGGLPLTHRFRYAEDFLRDVSG